VFSFVKTAVRTAVAVEGFQEGATSVTSLTLYLSPSLSLPPPPFPNKHGGTLRIRPTYPRGATFLHLYKLTSLHVGVHRRENNTSAWRGRGRKNLRVLAVSRAQGSTTPRSVSNCAKVAGTGVNLRVWACASVQRFSTAPFQMLHHSGRGSCDRSEV